MVFGRVFSRKSQSSVGEVLKGKDALSGNVELKYFDIGPKGSRGGPVRFMLQLHEVDFDENKIAPDASWMDVKKQLIESGENPCGTLPILTIDGNTYFHHLPILRLLAAKVESAKQDGSKRFSCSSMPSALTQRWSMSAMSSWTNTQDVVMLLGIHHSAKKIRQTTLRKEKRFTSCWKYCMANGKTPRHHF